MLYPSGGLAASWLLGASLDHVQRPDTIMSRNFRDHAAMLIAGVQRDFLPGGALAVLDVTRVREAGPIPVCLAAIER